MKLESKSHAGYFKMRKGLKCLIPKLIISPNSSPNLPKTSSKTNSKINGTGWLFKNSFPTLNGHKSSNGSNPSLSTIPLNKGNLPKPKLKASKQKLTQMNKFKSHLSKSYRTPSSQIESNWINKFKHLKTNSKGCPWSENLWKQKDTRPMKRKTLCKKKNKTLSTLNLPEMSLLPIGQTYFWLS